MTVLITADLHLNANPRDEYRHEFQTHLRKMVVRHGVECVYILGDLCDEKDYHSGTLVNRVVSHLTALAAHCPVAILKGNHDYTAESAVPFFHFLNKLEGITWVGEITDVDSTHLFLPHTHNWERDWKDVNFKTPRLILAHNTFAGAKVGARTLEGIPTDMFGKVPVISGDIHGPQTFGPITYVGAPYTINFGDDYEPRVLLIDTNNTTKSIPCPGPQKRLIRVSESDPEVKADHVNKGDLVKIQVVLSEGDYARWSEIKGELQEHAAKQGWITHLIQPVMPQTTRKSKRRSKTAAKSDQEILENFVKRRGVDDRTAKVGMELLES